MPEASADRRPRWFRVRWPGERYLAPAWAEKYFDTHPAAFAYAARRCAAHPTGRVSSPAHAHETPAAWAVCVDPV